MMINMARQPLLLINHTLKNLYPAVAVVAPSAIVHPAPDLGSSNSRNPDYWHHPDCHHFDYSLKLQYNTKTVLR